MKVIAKGPAFYQGKRVREGQVLDLPEGTDLARWMRPLLKGEAAASPPKWTPTPQSTVKDAVLATPKSLTEVLSESSDKKKPKKAPILGTESAPQ